MKQSYLLCWDVKECHIQDEGLCLILNTAKNLETSMRSVRSRMDYTEGSQGLFQCAIHYNRLEFCKGVHGKCLFLQPLSHSRFELSTT
jgi:hypothetical protein